MGRIARVVIPGLPQHVTQRGNDRQLIFLSDDDRQFYLSLYRHYTRRYGIKTFAYCLMDNHVHWVVVPEGERTLAQAFHAIDTKFAVRSNVKFKRTGHFFQGRFFSSVLDDEYLWTAVRYVERNPVRAGMVARAEDYAWSSAQAHCGLRRDDLLSFEFPPDGVIPDWRQWLQTENQIQVELLRRQTATGRPSGNDSFQIELESRLQRSLRPQKRGPRSATACDGQGDLFA